MDDKINYKTLFDFSKGKYSYSDYLKVKHWFTHVRDDGKVEEQLFDQWKNFADSPDMKSLRPIFERIQYQILLEEKRNGKKKNLWHLYRQVAAILIPIIAISASLYFFNQPGKSTAQAWLEINVPKGARVEFLLPDSTSGWLNSGAKLKYPSEFSRHRKVELLGEAFFNVRHMEHSDFTVGVSDMDITVLGTQFNVSAYANEAVTEVVLKEGKVEVKGKAAVFNQTLHPGEKISYNHEKSALNKLVVDPNIYTAWTNGFLVIDNEPLEQAVKKLERWYGAEISIQDEVLKNFRFKATFQEEPLEEVLRFIAMTTPMSYQIETRDQGVNGILKKKQVILKLKR